MGLYFFGSESGCVLSNKFGHFPIGSCVFGAFHIAGEVVKLNKYTRLDEKSSW